MLYSLLFSWKKIILFILAFLSFGAAIYIYVKSKMVQNTDHITFLTSPEIQQLLINDADHYYKTFQATDLKLRKSKSVEEYVERISKSGCEGSEEMKEKILDCIRKVENVLEPKTNDVINGIDMKQFLQLPWKIGFICDKKYENGLPHTRGDVIVLNNTQISQRTIVELCKLLIHEKVHVYQKVYKTDFMRSLKQEYVQIDEKANNRSIPANPDVDAYVYKRKKDGKILKTVYRKNPKEFRDVLYPENNNTLEHPNEIVAYAMESLYS